MANRYKADLLIEYISIIFEEDDQDRLKSMATYFFAVIERSSKEIQQIADNLELTTKSKLMSTLTLLKEEGVLEGIELGKQLGKQLGLELGKLKGIELGKKEGIELGKKETTYKKDVTSIRNMTGEKLSVAKIAIFLSLAPTYIKSIQKDLKKEPEILQSLAKKQKPKQIAKSLQLNIWLVEVMEELNRKKDKKGSI